MVVVIFVVVYRMMMMMIGLMGRKKRRQKQKKRYSIKMCVFFGLNKFLKKKEKIWKKWKKKKKIRYISIRFEIISQEHYYLMQIDNGGRKKTENEIFRFFIK